MSGGDENPNSARNNGGQVRNKDNRQLSDALKALL